MNDDDARILNAILSTQLVAALGTLHNGEPSVSMVPFAVHAETGGFLIHVSTLATHTKDMLGHPTISLLITAPLTPDVRPQALPRVTVRGAASPLALGDAGYAEARAAYLARFPDSALMFGFADFSLFHIVPENARLVGGFAQATSIRGDDVRALLSAPRP